jgi:hypothetical protein
MTMMLEPISANPISFIWSEREDGAEVFCCRRSDGSSTDILTAEELGSAEELIHSLALLPSIPLYERA